MNHDWLKQVKAPPLIPAAMQQFGLLEKPGEGDNPVILHMAEAVERARPGAAKDYKHDSIPWCGLFIAWACVECGYDFPDKPLWALNWAGFGEKAAQPGLGDVLVFKREGGGHVGLYVGEDATHFHVLGGNQLDSVSVTRIEKKRLHQARRPRFAAPSADVRPIILSADGAAVSTNEA
jgi:uncharacterized protein (TIGR02594 family)